MKVRLSRDWIEQGRRVIVVESCINRFLLLLDWKRLEHMYCMKKRRQ